MMVIELFGPRYTWTTKSGRVAIFGQKLIGDLPAIPVVTEGHGPLLPNLKLKDVADALLYLGPLASLETVPMSPSGLAGTPYGMEIERREKLQMV